MARAASASSMAWIHACSPVAPLSSSVVSIGSKSRSPGKEHRLPGALQTDVEAQLSALLHASERRLPRRLDRCEHLVVIVVGQIHSCDESLQQATGEHRYLDRARGI